MKKLLFVVFLLSMTLANAKVLKVGTGFGLPPFTYNDEKGDLVGYDVEMAKEVGKLLGYEVQFEQMDYSALIAAVQTGKVDLVATGMIITVPKAKKVDFSVPYFSNPGSSVLVGADNTDIKGVNDLYGKKVSCVVGSSQTDYLQNMNENKGSKKPVEIVEFPSIADSYLALEHNKVDASLNANAAAKSYMEQSGKGKVKIVGDLVPIKDVGMAMKKGNTKLKKEVDGALKTLFKNGKRDELAKKYFKK